MSRSCSIAQAVAGLLVAAVPEVRRVADDRQRQVVRDLLVPEPDEVRRVVAGVVADEDLRDPGPKRFGDAVEHARERRRRVVRDDEDPDARGAGLDGRGGCGACLAQACGP